MLRHIIYYIRRPFDKYKFIIFILHKKNLFYLIIIASVFVAGVVSFYASYFTLSIAALCIALLGIVVPIYDVGKFLFASRKVALRDDTRADGLLRKLKTSSFERKWMTSS